MSNIFTKLFKITSKLPAPPVTEEVKTISASQASMAMYGNTDINVDILLANRGYLLYTRDMLADDQVKACIMIKKLGVKIGGYIIQAAVGESDPNYTKAKELADFLNFVIIRMQGSLKNVLDNISHAIVTGFSVNEIVWEIIEEECPYKGLIGIKTIKMRPAETLSFDLDEFCNIKSIVQRIEGQVINIDPKKVLLFSYDPQNTGLPQGVSDLRAAYRHYWSKDALMRFRNVAAEKYAAPTGVGFYPPHFTKLQQADLLAAVKNIAIDSAIVVPDSVRIELLEAKGSVVMPYDASIDVCNSGIARAIFAQTLATNEGTTSGSFAQARIHRGILGMFLTDLRDSIADVLYEQLIKQLIDFNYGINLYPKIVLGAPSEPDLDALAVIMEKLINTGVVEKNEPFIREQFGFPPKPKELIDREQQIVPIIDKKITPAVDTNVTPGVNLGGK